MSRRINPKPEFALQQRVEQLWERFDYPDQDVNVPFELSGGGGGMTHILIVSTSEPDEIQEKADFVVNESNSSAQLQSIFDSIDDVWSIWMAGIFDLDSDVTAPDGCWIRGLGYTSAAVAEV